MRKLTTLLLVLVWPAIVNATPSQFSGLLTDSEDYTCVSTGVTPCTTWPLPAIPAIGGNYTDSLFGTTTKRLPVPTVCDGASFSGSPPCNIRQVIPNYSRQQAFNSDGTKYVLIEMARWVTIGGVKHYVTASSGSQVTIDGSDYAVTTGTSVSTVDIGGTVYTLSSGGGSPIIYDAATDTSIQAPVGLRSLGSNDLKWSNSDPDLMYVAKGLTLTKYKPSTDTETVAHTFACTDGVDTGDRVRNGDEGNSSYDNRYWANFCLKNANGKQITYNTYDAQTDTVIASKTPDQLCGGTCPAVANNQFLNWITVSPSGTYVIAQYTAIGGNDSLGHTRGTGTELFDINLNYLGYITNNHEHQDIGYDVNGIEVLVGEHESTGDVGQYHLVYIHRLQDVTPAYKPPQFVSLPCTYAYGGPGCNSGTFYNNSFHVSMQASQDVNSPNRGYALWSTWKSTPTTGQGWGANELFAVKIDSSVANGATWHRIGRTMSIRYPSVNYGSEPHATVNRDWTKILWGSNWNDPAGSVDGYMITLAAGPTGTAPTTTPSRAPGRYTATQQLALTASAGVAKYCFGAGCTPTATYSSPLKVLQNLARQTVRVQSVDGSNLETVQELTYLKQRRKGSVAQAASVTPAGWTVASTFEGGTLGAVAQGGNGFPIAGTKTTFSNTLAHSGTTSAKVHWDIGDEGWMAQHGEYDGLGALEASGEVWYRAYHYFPAGFDFTAVNVNKLMRLQSGAMWNSVFVNTDGTGDGKLVMSNEPSDWQPDLADSYMARGQWHAVEIYTKFGNPGIIRIWLDGVLKGEDITRDTGTWGNRAMFMSNWNGTSPAVQDHYVDDVVITSGFSGLTPQYDAAGNKMIGVTVP